MKTNKYLIAALAGITLAGCSSDDELQYSDFTGPVEVQFAGELTSDPILQTAWTRSGEEGGDGQDGADGQGDDAETESGGGSNSGSESTNDDWAAPYLSIGITPTSITGKTSSGNTIGKYFNVKYTTTSTGTTATFKAASDTIFFQSPKETVTFAAYSPYYEDLASDGDNKGIISLSADNAHNVTDYIWAKAEGATYTDNKVNFTFTHIQSKLKINVKLDESVSLPKEVTNTTTEPSVTIASVKIEGLVESGTFNTATGESTTASDADATEILYNYDANTGVSVAEGYEYIIIPQTIAAKGFILTVTTSNGDIYKKTFDSKITFAPGYAYTYNITAKKYNLEVEATISKWSEKDEEDEDAMMTKRTIAQFDVFSDPDETQIYDLAFSDGTFMRIADADGNIPQSITIPEEKTVRGVVYWVGDVAAEDGVLKQDYPNCSHGLILALNNATDYEWWGSSIDILSLQNSTSGYTENEGLYTSIRNTVLKIGYNNTSILQNLKCGCDFISYVKSANSSLILENASTWYIPSYAELDVLTPNLDKVHSVLSLLSRNGVSASTISRSIWTSTEVNYDCVYSYLKSFSSTQKFKNGYNYDVRFICAF